MASPQRSIVGPKTIAAACLLSTCRHIEMRKSLDKMLGWVPHNHREWIEFIIVALPLWLLMVVAISELGRAKP